MLKNYFKVDENTQISSFLKSVKDKKNTQYIILEGENYFVDIRTIALKAHLLNEKLKNLKKPLSVCNNCSDEEKFKKLVESGDRVIKIGDDNYYSFVDALGYVLNNNSSFLKDKLVNTKRDEIYAINLNDKISEAKNLFIKKRVNLLPVIDENLKIIGELRPIDLLVSDLYLTDKNSSDYYDENYENSKLNLPVESLINKRPIMLDSNLTYKDAIEKMIEKNLSSLIVTQDDKLYTIISYKDIFKLELEDESYDEFVVEYKGTSDLYEDDLDLIKDFVDSTMRKIVKVSNYDHLKVTFKPHGSVDSGHKKKFSLNLVLSKGNSIIHVDRETLGGTSDEIYNDKVKGRWNTPLLVQDALKVLYRKVIDEKRKANS